MLAESLVLVSYVCKPRDDSIYLCLTGEINPLKYPTNERTLL